MKHKIAKLVLALFIISLSYSDIIAQSDPDVIVIPQNTRFGERFIPERRSTDRTSSQAGTGAIWFNTATRKWKGDTGVGILEFGQGQGGGGNNPNFACSGVNDKILWNNTTFQWVCGTDQQGVTNLFVGNLSPLFITDVLNPTTNPSVSFTLNSQSPNLFFASPNGSTGNPAFRAILAADLPGLDTSKIVSGTFGTVRGGTGLSSYTIGDLLYASSTSALSRLTVGANGTCLTVSGGLPAWGACPTGGGGGGGITSLGGLTAASQTFGNDTNITITSSGSNHALGWTGTLAAARLNGSVVQAVTNDVNLTGSIFAQNLTLGWTGTLAAARLNSNVVHSVVNDANVTGTISGQALTFGWNGLLSVGRGGHGSAPTGGDQIFVSSSTSAGAWKTLPSCLDTGGQHLNYDPATDTWLCGTTSSTSGVGGSGTANTIPKWTAGTTLGNSQITDNGTTVGIGTGATGILGGGTLELNGSTSGKLTQTVPASLTSYTFSWPSAAGTTGDCLKYGTPATWGACGTGGGGSGVTDGDKGDVVISGSGATYTVETVGGQPVAKVHLGKTSDPTASDNTLAGYGDGDEWITTVNKVWRKVSQSGSTAVWVDLTTTGGTGDVVGPSSATANAITRFNGTTGKLVKNSSVTVDDSGNITANSISTGSASSACDGTAGCVQLGQGTAPSALGTTAIQVVAPTAVTSYRVTKPAAACSGLIRWSNSSNLVTESCVDDTIVVQMRAAGALTTGDGKDYFHVPAKLNGWILTEVRGNLVTVSSSGVVNFDIARCAVAATGNQCAGVVDDVLSTNGTFDVNEARTATAATPLVINTANDDAATDAVFRLDIDGAGTGAVDLTVTLVFSKP